jgi:type I restriction enzyme R subunit
MDKLAALAREKEAAMKAARESGLSGCAFGVYWRLKDDAVLGGAGISAMGLAKETDCLLARFPNARDNTDEQRRLRAALYRPLLGLEREQRGRVVATILSILLDGQAKENA